MARGRRTQPLYPDTEEWRAARDPRGQWVVVNGHGERVLQHPEAAIRMQAVHLAAAAPRLRVLLETVTKRLRITLVGHGSYYCRDMVLVNEALIAIGDSRPPFTEYLRERSRQQEIELDGEDAVPAIRGTAVARGRTAELKSWLT